ncbi:MAG: hypothetical protein K0R61_2167 [Microvirga sp.]|jgi:hypothetical protein|nr:hypothetical protein [Microvirga sp.]
MSEDTTAIVAAILAAASVQTGQSCDTLLAKYQECLEHLGKPAAAEPKPFAGSVDAPPERGEDALGWAGRED